MLLKVLFVVIFVFVFVEGCTYKGLECSNFTLLQKSLEYEVRSYPSLTWAITDEISRLGKPAVDKASKRLTEYFEGNNNRSMDIPKALPIRMKVSHLNKFNHEVGFLVPSNWTKDPPCPIDITIRLVQEPPTIYVVSSFSGYYSKIRGVPDKTWEQEANKIAEILKDDDSVKKSDYYKCLYDSPPSLYTESHNEIWMIKEVD